MTDTSTICEREAPVCQTDCTFRWHTHSC